MVLIVSFDYSIKKTIERILRNMIPFSVSIIVLSDGRHILFDGYASRSTHWFRYYHRSICWCRPKAEAADNMIPAKCGQRRKLNV